MKARLAMSSISAVEYLAFNKSFGKMWWNWIANQAPDQQVSGGVNVMSDVEDAVAIIEDR